MHTSSTEQAASQQNAYDRIRSKPRASQRIVSRSIARNECIQNDSLENVEELRIPVGTIATSHLIAAKSIALKGRGSTERDTSERGTIASYRTASQ